MFNARLIYESLKDAPSCHCSSLIELPDHRLFVAFFAGAHEKAKDVAIWTSSFNLTQDFHQGTWSTPRILVKTPDCSMGSPVWYLDPNNRLYIFFLVMHHGKILPAGWSVCTIQYRFSEDLGVSWSQNHHLRRWWFWVNRAPIIIAEDNSVIFPMHRELFTLQSFMYINSKADLSGKWKRYGRLKTQKGCLEPSVTKLKSGQLICALRTKDKYIYFSRSNDHGKTWTKPEPTAFPNPNSQCAIYTLKSGRLILVYNHSFDSRSPLSIVYSDDEGRTWSDRIDIETEPKAEFSYPAILQSLDGNIHITYTYYRKQIKHVVFTEDWLHTNH
jgi:predicted neuraminidase